MVAHETYENRMQGKSQKVVSSKQVCEVKEETEKGKLNIEGTEDLTQEEFEEIDEHLAFISRRFSKLNFKINSSLSRPSTTFRKDSQSGKSVVDRSKFKCFNCGIASHFSNECRKPKSKKKKSH